jgi:hypothetical protein
MSFDMLDPWSDAATIAGRLRQPGSFLVVLLAAESWCRKCREFRPVFDRAAQGANAGEVWLWLDLEDHAEFVGDSIPDDLPWLLVYRDKVLWKSELATEAALSGALDPGAVPSPAWPLHLDTPDKTDKTDIRARLLQDDWGR